jgi:hypothetical protein
MRTERAVQVDDVNLPSLRPTSGCPPQPLPLGAPDVEGHTRDPGLIETPGQGGEAFRGPWVRLPELHREALLSDSSSRLHSSDEHTVDGISAKRGDDGDAWGAHSLTERTAVHCEAVMQPW